MPNESLKNPEIFYTSLIYENVLYSLPSWRWQATFAVIENDMENPDDVAQYYEANFDFHY